MGAPFKGAPPRITVNGVTFDAPLIYRWLERVKLLGGQMMISISDPAPPAPPAPGGDSESPQPPRVWARSWTPDESIGLENVYIWAMMPGRDFGALGANIGVMQAEVNLIPFYADDTHKFTGLYISGGSVDVFSPWTGDGKFWRDFVKASIVVAAIAVTAGAVIGAAPAEAAVIGAGSAPAVPAAAAPAVVAPGTVATVTGTSGFTLAEIAAGAKTAAGIATSAATVVKTVSAVSNAGIDWGNVKDAAKNAADIAASAERAKLSVDNLTGDPQTMLYIGAAILAVMVI